MTRAGRIRSPRFTVEYIDYTQFIEPIRHRMVNSIWKIARNPDDTDDILQNALLNVTRNMTSIRKHPNPTALILRTCINCAIDFRRKASCRPVELDCAETVHEISTPQASPAERMLWRERQARVLNAIQTLPPREAEAIVLLAVEDFSYPQIAQAMGCREATVRVLVMKARKRLKEALAKEPAEIVQIFEKEA